MPGDKERRAKRTRTKGQPPLDPVTTAAAAQTTAEEPTKNPSNNQTASASRPRTRLKSRETPTDKINQFPASSATPEVAPALDAYQVAVSILDSTINRVSLKAAMHGGRGINKEDLKSLHGAFKAMMENHPVYKVNLPVLAIAQEQQQQPAETSGGLANLPPSALTTLLTERPSAGDLTNFHIDEDAKALIDFQNSLHSLLGTKRAQTAVEFDSRALSLAVPRAQQQLESHAIRDDTKNKLREESTTTQDLTVSRLEELLRSAGGTTQAPPTDLLSLTLNQTSGGPSGTVFEGLLPDTTNLQPQTILEALKVISSMTSDGPTTQQLSSSLQSTPTGQYPGNLIPGGSMLPSRQPSADPRAMYRLPNFVPFNVYTNTDWSSMPAPHVQQHMTALGGDGSFDHQSFGRQFAAAELALHRQQQEQQHIIQDLDSMTALIETLMGQQQQQQQQQRPPHT